MVKRQKRKDDDEKSILEKEKGLFAKNANASLNSMGSISDNYGLHGGIVVLTADVTILVLMATLMSESVKSGVYQGKEWIAIVIVSALFLSLFSWLLDYSLSLHYNNKRWRQLFALKDEAVDTKCLADFERIKEKLFDFNHPKIMTPVFRVLQLSFFVVGAGFLSVLVILSFYS